jgi:hypothetical protein
MNNGLQRACRDHLLCPFPECFWMPPEISTDRAAGIFR